MSPSIYQHLTAYKNPWVIYFLSKNIKTHRLFLNVLAKMQTRLDPIDLIHKSQNALVPYHITLHSEQKCAHFCSEWNIVGFGTCEFWDL